MKEVKYTLWQRICSDTPLFFKQMQVLGLGLVAAGKALNEAGYIRTGICTACIAIGTTLIIVSQFAVKQFEPINFHTYDDTKQPGGTTD